MAWDDGIQRWERTRNGRRVSGVLLIALGLLVPCLIVLDPHAYFHTLAWRTAVATVIWPVAIFLGWKTLRSLPPAPREYELRDSPRDLSALEGKGDIDPHAGENT